MIINMFLFIGGALHTAFLWLAASWLPQILIPTTCECCLYGKGNFANIIQVEDLEAGRLSWTTRGRSKEMVRDFIGGKGGRRVRERSEDRRRDWVMQLLIGVTSNGYRWPLGIGGQKAKPPLLAPRDCSPSNILILAQQKPIGVTSLCVLL